MSFGRIVFDFETRSVADLKEVGAWVYSLHPTTELICACWKIIYDDGNVSKGFELGEWIMGQDPAMPPALREAVMAGYDVEAHNYSFELAIWTNVCVPRMGWAQVMPSQWRDTMAATSYYAMPAALDQLSRALGMGGKDPEGSRLISRYSKLHLKTAKTEIPPDDLAKFVAYCRNDVEQEAIIGDYLGDLPAREQAVFSLDQKINMRGLYLDAAGIAAATEIVEKRREELTTRFNALTGYNPTQTAKVAVWCAERGVVLDNMQAEYLSELIEGDELGQGEVREALTIRRAINKSSTSKLAKMAAERDPRDGRARWQCRYHGAQTGRWTGGGFQPLNLVRSWEAPKGQEEEAAERLVQNIMLRDGQWLDMLYGDAMEAVSKAGRHWIMAPPGKQLYAADFVSIEAVILACLAGEEWKIDAFREGRKIYELMGDTIHRLPEGTVTKATHPAERQDGKTGELAFGFQGALGAWLKFDSSGRHSDERINEIKDAWRDKHPMIVAFWAGLENAAIEAVSTGKRTSYRDIGFEIVDEWLSMILPNEKRIWYRSPELKIGMPAWHKPEVNEDCRENKCRCRPRTSLTYMAQKEGQWKRVATYGGKLAENATQATSREFLVPSIVASEAAGYPVILTVYDEIVAEVPKDFGSLEEFCAVLKNAPGREWAKGWPIGVDGWVGKRYRK